MSSVLDVGCGRGAWLKIWADLHVTDVLGVDGRYVDQTKLLIPKEKFVSADLSYGFRTGKQYGLVQCLEVAEHLDASRAEDLIDTLSAHGKVILFSAAVPGQGGNHHVNERHPTYWRKLFADRDYLLFDFVRPKIIGNKQVASFYRYNLFLYVHRSVAQTLPSEVKSSQIEPHQEIPTVAPLAYRVRCNILSIFPSSLVTRVVKLRTRYLMTKKRPL